MIHIAVYLFNIIIRVLFAWLMFIMFGSGHFFFAALFLICTLKRSWIVYDESIARKFTLTHIMKNKMNIFIYGR